ncbi:MAG: sugar ABC transporter permease, partial [Ruminococcus sp.]|nr:sugar ABC transporter permease [Ruminococcus sp.]
MKKSITRKGWGWLMPSLLGVLLFFLLPFGIVIFYSLIDSVVTKKFVGLKNFTELLGNEAFLLAVKNTLLFTLTAIPLSMLLALLLALLLERAVPAKSI